MDYTSISLLIVGSYFPYVHTTIYNRTATMVMTIAHY